MSYLDELLALGRSYDNNTVILEDGMTETWMNDSGKNIWTYVGKGTFSYKRTASICCLDKNAVNKCTINRSKLLSASILGIAVESQPHYTWEQYDISIFCKGNILDADNVIGGVVITRPVVIKQTTGSIARVLVPGTSDTILNITVNGVVFGTILYGSGSATGLITLNRTIEVSDGDVIGIVSTNIFDAGMEDYVITLSGLAQNVEIWDTVT